MGPSKCKLITLYPSEYTGGAETLLLRIVQYSVNSRNSLLMLTIEDDFVYRNLDNKYLAKMGVKILDKSILKPTTFLNDDECQEISDSGRRISYELSYCINNRFVYAPYFNNLQMSMMFLPVN